MDTTISITYRTDNTAIEVQEEEEDSEATEVDLDQTMDIDQGMSI